MTKFDFSGPYLKVERADKHINELETLLRFYVALDRLVKRAKHPSDG